MSAVTLAVMVNTTDGMIPTGNRDLDASDSKVSVLSKEAAHAAGAADVQIEIFEARP